MAVGSDRVIDVLFTSETLVLSLADGCVLIVPLAWYPRLRDAPADARARLEHQHRAPGARQRLGGR